MFLPSSGMQHMQCTFLVQRYRAFVLFFLSTLLSLPGLDPDSKKAQRHKLWKMDHSLHFDPTAGHSRQTWSMTSHTLKFGMLLDQQR